MYLAFEYDPVCIFYCKLHVYVCGNVLVGAGAYRGQKKVSAPLKVVTGGYELPITGAGN